MPFYFLSAGWLMLVSQLHIQSHYLYIPIKQLYMQTILLPVDFSAASRNASMYAAEIARLLNTRILLFHAYLMPTPISEVPYAMVTVDNLQKENEDQLKKEAEFLQQQYGVQTEWLVRIGTASDEIKTITKEQPIGLIVMRSEERRVGKEC